MQSQASAIIAPERSLDCSAKFKSNGEALYFPGITIISEPKLGGGANSSDDLSNAVLETCFRGLEQQILDHFVVLPEPSLHMTILDVIAYHRDVGKQSRAELENLRAEQMTKFNPVFEELKPAIQQLLPIKATINLYSEKTPRNGETLGVPFLPYDEEASRKISELRSMIASRLDMPQLFKSDYELHITVAYPYKAISDVDFETVIRPLWLQRMANLVDKNLVYTIENVRLCIFDTMLSFETQSVVHAG